MKTSKIQIYTGLQDSVALCFRCIIIWSMPCFHRGNVSPWRKQSSLWHHRPSPFVNKIALHRSISETSLSSGFGQPCESWFITDLNDKLNKQSWLRNQGYLFWQESNWRRILWAWGCWRRLLRNQSIQIDNPHWFNLHRKYFTHLFLPI